MIVTYVEWRDASYSQGDTNHADLSLIDLVEVGFLVKETAEFITLSIERPDSGQEDYRLTLSIPKVNITKRVAIDIGRKVRGRKTTKADPGTRGQDALPEVESANGS